MVLFYQQRRRRVLYNSEATTPGVTTHAHEGSYRTTVPETSRLLPRGRDLGQVVNHERDGVSGLGLDHLHQQLWQRERDDNRHAQRSQNAKKNQSCYQSQGGAPSRERRLGMPLTWSYTTRRVTQCSTVTTAATAVAVRKQARYGHDRTVCTTAVHPLAHPDSSIPRISASAPLDFMYFAPSAFSAANDSCKPHNQRQRGQPNRVPLQGHNASCLAQHSSRRPGCRAGQCDFTMSNCQYSATDPAQGQRQGRERG